MTPVCIILVILTDNESHLINYLTDFVVRMHKAELVWCRFDLDFSGLVTSQEEDMVFRLTLKSIGKNRQLFKKRKKLISQGYTYKYILKLRKAQEKMLDKMYTPKIGGMC